MPSIQFGWSEVELIPKGALVSLAGQFYERISDEVESPLTVTALAVESSGDAAIFCSCDLVSVSQHLISTVRKILKSRPDIPAEKLIVSAIHTHTAPNYAKRSDAFGKLRILEVLKKISPTASYQSLVSEKEGMFTDQVAHDYLAARIAEAAVQAWDRRKVGSFAPGFGRAAVGHCRRVCYDDGSAKMWGDTDQANFMHLEGPSDSGIEMLFTFTPEGKLTGVVATVACPAQVLEHRSVISSDYWGKVKEYLRREWGDQIFVLGLCAPAGDQCPRDLIRWVEPESPINDPNISRENPVKRGADPSMFDLQGCCLVGRRIANEIIWARDRILSPISDTLFCHRAEKLTLPIRRVTLQEQEKAMQAIRDFLKENGDAVNYKDSARLHIHVGTVSRFEYQQTHDTVDIEVHFLRLGDLAFATNPYELFLDYGNRIRARSRASQTFLIQLCGGSFGYLPTFRAQEGGHYSAYVSSGTVGFDAGDLLVRKSVEAIRDLFAEKQ